MKKPILALAAGLPLLASGWKLAAAEPPQVELKRDQAQGRLVVSIGGTEAVVYNYQPELDLPHYFPVRSPGGKSMTVQHPRRFPHHRSFWFADKVRLAGQRDVNFYACLYTRENKNDPNSPLRDRVRHVEFTELAAEKGEARVGARLLWEMDRKTPVLDEIRVMRIKALGKREYLLQLSFTVSAAYGDVTFTSDWVHYAWPYVRMNSQFAVDGGGRITNSEGGVNQQQTNGKPAHWVDYSNTVEGETAGLAIFSHPDNPQPHKWLTRDYGCFGPRRIDARSGTGFTLKKGESLVRRVGILVHRGDVLSGKVAQRYKQYVEGSL